MSQNLKYNRLNKESLKGELLINIRDFHIKRVSKELLESKIFSIEYIDNYIGLECLQKNIPIIINDGLRLEFINKLLYKECVKHTSRTIIELCNE
jgi:hypothetical protein